MKQADKARSLQRLVSLRVWVSPKGGPEGDDDRHKSCFGFAWWFWVPTIFHQKPVNLRGFQNARDIRLMWGCFCVACRVGYDGPVSPTPEAMQYADYILNHYSRTSRVDKLCLAIDLERHGWKKQTNARELSDGGKVQ